MNPRTVQMAKEVESQFTTSQLKTYGNIILNGYAQTVPNTINKKRWQYKETATAPINLPSLVEYTPALKGWTTNYMQYYTQLPINGYNQIPGNPAMFNYSIHSFTPATGPVTGLGSLQSGQGYTPGVYTNVATVGGRGAGATLDITVDINGNVTIVALNNPGVNYAIGDGLGVAPATIGSGYGFAVSIATIAVVNPAGEPQWAQAPRRLIQSQVLPFVPSLNNPAAIQYSAILYPVSDNPIAPPVDTL